MEETEILIQKAQQGNKEAFGILYKEYFQRIYRYCRVNMYRDELAEDVCQETFVRAWKALPTFTFKHGGTFQAFLYRIARNLIIDLSRKKKEYSIEYYEEIQTDENYEEAIDRQDSMEKVKRALAKLKDEERQIIILRYFEEISHAEIAKILGIKEGAVRVRTVRLLQKVKGILEHEK